jgi:hypothetical protein
MSSTQVNVRRLSVVATAACGLVALSACSSGGSTGASSASSTTSVTSTAPSSSATASRSALASSSAADPSGAKTSAKTPVKATPKPAASTEAKKPVPKADPVGACKTANAKSNAAIMQWNSAVSSQLTSKLDAAARNFRTTASTLRKLPYTARQAGFTTRARAVATDLDSMAKARFAGQTVDPSKYNTDSEKLRSYCQAVLTK